MRRQLFTNSFPRRIARKTVMSIRFWNRTFRSVRLARKIDKKSPFEGPMREHGFSEVTLQNQDWVVTQLTNLLERNAGLSGGRVHLDTAAGPAIEKIFTVIVPNIVLYLGDSARLDGFKWFVTKHSDAKDISSNWHTDGVGNRIKVFLCLQGDGTMPTLIIPDAKRVPSLFSWIRLSFFDSIRWVRKEYKTAFENVISIRHRTGTVYMFDTNLLHRGGYETGGSLDRIVLQVDFSVPDKHHLFGKKSVIGTQEENYFSFDRELLDIAVFQKLLDQRRVRETSSGFLYSPLTMAQHSGTKDPN